MQAYEPTTQTSAPLNHPLPWARLLGHWASAQVHAEIFGMPGYGLTLKGAQPDGFIAAPNDIRLVDPHNGTSILSGRIALAGAKMSFQASNDPWNRPAPSHPFAIELHRFSWLSSLMATGEAGIQEAMRLLHIWHKTFRKWTPFAWSDEVLPRRLINLAVQARRISAVVSAEDSSFLARFLAEQGRHITRLSKSSAYITDQAIALIVLGSVLSGAVGDRFRVQGLKLLPRALKKSIYPDGGHATRSAERSLDLLYDLFLIDDALAQRGQILGDVLEKTIDSLGLFVRAMTHPSGHLVGFQGSAALVPEQVLPALLRLESRPNSVSLPEQFASSRFQKLRGDSLCVFVDTGEPRTGIWGYASCDQSLSVEISGGHDRLIILPGWSPLHSEHQIYRLMPAANGLTLDGQSILSPLSGPLGQGLGYTLEGRRYKVKSRRVESEDPGSLLEIEHNGWVPSHGLTHERRLFVDKKRDELRGEDRLIPVPGRANVPDQALFEIKFHLHHEVQASLARDRKSVLLRGPGGRGWWLRHDAKDVGIDRSSIFEHEEILKSSVIILRGHCSCATQTRIRWKLTPTES